MPEPLLGHQALAADCDPVARLATVQARPAGPAGSAGLDLGAGIELDIDVADPVAVAGLTIELPSSGDPGVLPLSVRRRLDVLLGPERAAAVGSIVREGADAQSHVQRRVGDAAASPDGAPLPVLVGVAPALHRSALAHAAACQPGAPRLVRAAGLLEAAAALAHLTHRLDMRQTAGHDARVGADLLLDLGADDLVTVPDRRAAADLASVVLQASRLLADQPLAAGRMAALADELARGDHTTGATSATSADRPRDATPPAASGLGRRVPLAVSSLPGALAEASLAGRRTGPSEVEVRIDAWADRRHELWARAFDATADSLLALAPFRVDGHDAVAHLLVPPDAIRQIEVDVTDRPEMPRPSPALAAVQRAIHLGTIAARAERLGDGRRAAHRWRHCARTWQTAGDPARAEQARTYADLATTSDPDGLGRIIRPLVSDLIEGGHP